MPRPRTPIGTRILQYSESGSIPWATQNTAMEVSPKPVAVRIRGCTLSVNRPTTGAMTSETTAIGTISSDASSADSPRTSWAQSMRGKPIATAAKPMHEMPTLDTEKLRSANISSGTSGSLRLRASHRTNSANMTIPTAISAHTTASQPRCSPSWMPKTRANMPTPLSSTPSQSNACSWVESTGTSRQLR